MSHKAGKGAPKSNARGARKPVVWTPRDELGVANREILFSFNGWDRTLLAGIIPDLHPRIFRYFGRGIVSSHVP